MEEGYNLKDAVRQHVMKSESKKGSLDLQKKIRDRVAQLEKSGDHRESDEIEIEIPPRAKAEISAKALQTNYGAILDQLKNQALLPMIKANAYGHGAVWAARHLRQAKNLYGFGVASLEEGREVRDGLGARDAKIQILVVSGTTNWSDEKGQYCERFGLTPVICSDEDWTRFFKGGWTERLKYHLKFNTGMNRLGMSTGLVQQVVSQLKGKPAEQRPQGIGSHLACAEDPEHALTRMQIERFRSLRGELEGALPGTLFHLANSSAIWNQKHYGLEGLTDIARPGLSLYGVPPWPGAPARGTVPVMELSYQIVQRRRLKAGESIGYGATYRVSGKGSDSAVQEVAIVSAGYADGIHRVLSNQGQVRLDGRMRKFLGIVSMDLSAIECDASTQVGQYVQILGTGLDPWTQAKAAGTIPYELFTSVSPRVRKVET